MIDFKSNKKKRRFYDNISFAISLRFDWSNIIIGRNKCFLVYQFKKKLTEHSALLRMYLFMLYYFAHESLYCCFDIENKLFTYDN